MNFKISSKDFKLRVVKLTVATPLWPSVRMKLTPKVGDLESSGTPECLEFDIKGKKPRLGVFLVSLERSWSVDVRNGLALVIWTSTTQVMGKRRESNCQFDSRPLKVGNRPAPDVRWGSATRRWKVLEEGYKFDSDLVPIGGRGEKLWCPKIPGVQNRDSFGTSLWESRDKQPLGCGRGGVMQRIL
jgi:hypothetical protein